MNTTETNHFTDENETEQNLTVAKSINLYSQENENADYNCLAHRFKGIVNAENPKQIFDVVGKDYKIIQHNEVYDKVIAKLKELGLRHEVKTTEFKEGARLRLVVNLPDLIINVGPREINDIVAFRMTFDNSYDSSKGLTAFMDGMRLACLNGQTVPDRFSKFYHRHTPGCDVNKMIDQIDVAVDRFQTKLKEKFDAYYNTKIDPSKARTFLEECKADKNFKVSNKYLEEMIRKMDFGGNVDISGEADLTNQWGLYNLITEVMTHDCQLENPDTREDFIRQLDNRMNRKLSSLLAV